MTSPSVASVDAQIDALVRALVLKTGKEKLDDLQCPQCGSMLHDPWTLGSGRTVCAACVTRVEGERVPPVVNSLLASIVKACLPQSADAAARRSEGNDHFKNGRFQEAVDSYSEAARLDEGSSAALANRSLAYLRMQRHADAIADACRAVELRPQWPKWQLRLAAALRAGGEPGRALVPLLRVVALEQVELNNSIDVGSEVRIDGSDEDVAQYQGQRGVCVACDRDQDRWEVRLQNSKAIQVKREQVWVDGKTKGSSAKKEVLVLAQEGHELPDLSDLMIQEPPLRRQISLAQVQNLRDDFDCCMCSELICQPTVLPCGHCMCRDCVARLLDHALQTEPACPLCRHELMTLLRQVNLRARDKQRSGLRFAHGGSQLTICSELEKLFGSWMPDTYSARLAEIRAPQSEWVPIFVCSLSAPFLPTPLHIFEPRYRLMMRRCVESNLRFGMCLPTEEGFADVGTMLFIERFEQLPDGRSLIETKGVSRFHVLERGTLDGYSTALIKPYDEDTEGYPVSRDFGSEALALRVGAQTFMSIVSQQRKAMAEQLENQLGPLPDVNIPQFAAHMSFYAAQLLHTIGVSQTPDTVFLQPERERWKCLLQECARFQPLGEVLHRFCGDPSNPHVEE